MKAVVTKRTIGRVFFLPSAVLTVAGVLFFIAILSGEKPLADAQVVNFYANECAGGWDGATLAALEPQVTSGTLQEYTKENSAYLENRLSPITCGQFTGTLPPETYHTRVMVRFSWTQIPPESPEADFESPTVSVPSETGVATSTGTTSENVSDGEGEVPEVNQGTTTVDSTEASLVGTTTSETASSSISLPPNASTTVVVPDEGATSSLATPTETIGTTSPETVLEATTEEPAPATTESPETETVSESSPALRTPPESSGLPEPEPVTPAAQPAPDVVSWWPFVWTAYAEAEELATSTTDLASSTEIQLIESEELVPTDMATDTATETVVATTTTDTLATTSSETMTGGEGAQFVVQYTLDGMTWQVLGYVTTIDADVRLEFPKDILPTLGDISRVQLSVTPLLHIDTMPPVYLDAVWLEVSYAPLGELGVHGISDIVPSITPFEGLISDTVATGSFSASTTGPLVSPAAFVQGITAVYGIDEQHVLVTLTIGTSTKELWLFDMKKYLIHRIGKDAAEIGTMPPSAKDGMIFWLNSRGDTLYTYDLRTAGSLHEMILVGNLPTGTDYTLTFPFTDWEVLWRGDAFYYRARKTGEIFQDENTDSVRTFLTYFDVVHALPYERLQAISGAVIPEEESAFTIISTSTNESVDEVLSTSTVESMVSSSSEIDI